MEQYQVGKLLKEYRKRKNISQEELCGTTCAVSTLSRIERGEQVPDRKLIQIFFERLGMSVPPLDIPMNKIDFERYNLEVQIQNMVAAGNYTILELLEKYNSYDDKMNRFELQFFKFYTAVYELRNNKKTNYEVLQHFCDAMNLTIAGFNSDSDLNNYLFSNIEILILVNLSITEYFCGQEAKAITRMEFLKKYFDNNEVEEKLKSQLYLLFLFHLSNWYGQSGNNQKAYEYADEGIKYCNLYGSLSLFPYFVFNKGYALAEKGLMEEGKSYIKNSFDIMKLLGKEIDIQNGIEEVNNKFGFDFSLRF